MRVGSYSLYPNNTWIQSNLHWNCNMNSDMSDFRGVSRVIHSFINGSTAFCWGPWPLLQFRNIFYTDGRTPLTSDQPVARPLSIHRTKQIQNKRAYRHPCLERDSNQRSQHPNERRQYTYTYNSDTKCSANMRHERYLLDEWMKTGIAVRHSRSAHTNTNFYKLSLP
jgi:hypothetical protein